YIAEGKCQFVLFAGSTFIVQKPFAMSTVEKKRASLTLASSWSRWIMGQCEKGTCLFIEW
ncbi:hypothetical protein XENOCAPTIV_007312, partial [Xenoophorus captivus]